MKNNNKTHVSFWLDKNDLKECEAMAEATNCRSRSEYIADAVRFYNGDNHDKKNEEYINTKVVNSLKKMMTNFENRLGRAMFKQAVEMAKIYWILRNTFDIKQVIIVDSYSTDDSFCIVMDFLLHVYRICLRNEPGLKN